MILKKDKFKYYLIYTCIFIPFIFVLYSFLLFNHLSLFGDGDRMSETASISLGFIQYVKDITEYFINNHKFIIPEYNFFIGEGMDSIVAFNNIPNIYKFFLIFTNKENYYIFHHIFILLLFYGIGVAFSEFVFYIKKCQCENFCKVLIGAFSYIFCSYGIIYGTSYNPTFLTTLFLFSILILGIEKTIRNEKPILFIIALFVNAFDGFYFFYMNSIIIGIYTLCRLLFIYKNDFKTIITYLIKIFLYAIISLMLATFILIPNVMTYFGYGRSDNSIQHSFLYPLKYYLLLPIDFISLIHMDVNWASPFLGFSTIAVPSILLLFINKNRKLLKILFIISIIFMLFPIFGSIMNGFNYPNNRWNYALSLLVCYIIVDVYDDFFEISIKERIYIILLTFCFSIIGCVWPILHLASGNMLYICINLIIVAILSIVIIISFYKIKNIRLLNRFILSFVLIGIIINVQFFYQPFFYNWLKDNYTFEYINDFKNNNEATAIKQYKQKISDTDFSRFTSYANAKSDEKLGNNFQNVGIIYKEPSLSFYSSIVNGSTMNYKKELSVVNEYFPFMFYNYDDRASLTALSNTKYLIRQKNLLRNLMYGYKKVDEIKYSDDKDYEIYENENYLPYIYVYDNVISENELLSYNSPIKQELMLSYVSIPNDNNEDDDTTINNNLIDTQKINFSYENNNDVIFDYDNKQITVLKDEAKLKVDFDGLPNSETYLDIINLNAKYITNNNVLNNQNNINQKSFIDKLKYFKNRFYNYGSQNLAYIFTINTSNNFKKYFRYETDYSPVTNNAHNFTINLGYNKEKLISATITFMSRGVYTFDEFNIYCSPMDNFSDKIKLLKNETVTDINVGEVPDTITANLDLSKNKFVVITVPYSKGFTAYVDGEKKELYRANIHYTGIYIDSGKHQLKIVYHRPYQLISNVVSIIGLFVFISLVIYENKFKKKLEVI